MYKRSNRHTPFVKGFALILLAFFAIDATGQTRRIQRNGWYRDAPIEVYDLQVKGRSVSFNEAFEADADWLKSVSLKIRNDSGKTIVCIYLAVIFSETAPAPMLHPKFFGHPTNTRIRPAGPTGPPLALRPGEVLTASLADEYEKWKRAVEKRRPIDSVSVLDLEITRAYFEDGMMWDLGGLYRPDPDNFGKWVLVKDGVWIPPV